MWRWRRFKWWLGGVRHGATYRDALELILGGDIVFAGGRVTHLHEGWGFAPRPLA